MSVSMRDYRVKYPNDWCPGCGDYGILTALQRALAALDFPRHQAVIVGGIGCSGKAQYYVNAYGVHTLHGRALPYATGIKLANPELTVVVVGGDGDGLGIGAGHFVSAGRRNVDLTYILFNNEVYGLTKGQASPTLPLGLQTKSLPEPTIQGKVNPVLLAVTSGFSWVGRQYAYNVGELSDLIQRGIRHEGLSLVEVIQPCPTYNDLHTRDWYAGEGTERGDSRFYPLAGSGYEPVVNSPEEREQLMPALVARAQEWGDRIPLGVFLDDRSISTYGARITGRIPGYTEAPPATRRVSNSEGRSVADLQPLFDEATVPRGDSDDGE